MTMPSVPFFVGAVLALTGLVHRAAAQTPGAAPDNAVYRDSKAPVEQRVEDLLQRLTLDEKIDQLAGGSNMETRGVARLGLRPLVMSDGPMAVRCYGKATAYPGGVALAASFDVEQAQRLGAALGRDARARGVHILLGPAMNLYRSPMCGRNFEYLGEDPIGAGLIAAAYTRGCQGQGVAVTIKHFAGNEQEYERVAINTTADERTLRELYLRPFEICLKTAQAWCVMDSYNPLNGTYTTQNAWLNNTVLKEEWKFPGLLMSDWGATHDTLGAANGGLDLEMPYPGHFNRARLLPLVKNRKVTEATIDDKIRRRLRMTFAMGWFDRPQKDPSIALDDPANSQVALEGARRGIVLLKNEGRLLPLKREETHSIVVLGPTADPAVVCGGGSADIEPFQAVSMFAGLKTKAGANISVTRVPWSPAGVPAGFFAASPVEGTWKCQMFAGKELAGAPLLTRQDPAIDFNWGNKPPAPNLPRENYSARWTGTIKPAGSGTFVFRTLSDDGARVLLDGKAILDDWSDHGPHMVDKQVPLEAGKSYAVTVEYYQARNSAELHFGWGPPSSQFSDQTTEAIRQASAVVMCVGFNDRVPGRKSGTYEGEGADRRYALPPGQVECLLAALKLNPRMVVVLNAGGAVETSTWLVGVPALVDVFYPGQEGGTALAEILFGDNNPSGKLPFTWEKRWEDCAAYGHYPEDKFGRINEYKEAVLAGYRWFDAKKIDPLFAFGYGLSYTRFSFDKAAAEYDAALGQLRVTASVTNAGTRAGATVIQLYVTPPPAPVERPLRELKGFARVELAPGETKVVAITVPRDLLAYWDPATKAWTVTPGTYQLQLGDSSRNLPVTTTIDFK